MQISNSNPFNNLTSRAPVPAGEGVSLTPVKQLTDSYQKGKEKVGLLQGQMAPQLFSTQELPALSCSIPRGFPAASHETSDSITSP